MEEKIKELWPKYTFFPGQKIPKLNLADLLLELYGEKAAAVAAKYKE